MFGPLLSLQVAHFRLGHELSLDVYSFAICCSNQKFEKFGKRFEKRGPQYLDAETGIKASAYLFGTRELLVYEEAETGLVVLIHPSAWKENSPKS